MNSATISTVALTRALVLSFVSAILVSELVSERSHPEIPSYIQIDNLTITTPDGVSFNISGLEASADGRIVDMLAGLAADGTY